MSTHIAHADKKPRSTARRHTAVRPVARRIGHEPRRIVNAREIVDAAADATNGEVFHLRDYAAEYLRQGQHGMHTVWQACRKRIRDRPYNSMLIAAGAGVVAAGAGWLLGRLWKQA